METLEVKITHAIEIERIQNLICSAVESNGIGYWVKTYDPVYGKGFSAVDLQPGGKLHDPDAYKFSDNALYLLPFVGQGCGILFIEFEEDDQPKKQPKKHLLDLDAIKKGLELFATDKQYAHHWQDFFKDNDDAITADVFMQWCLLGQQVYG